jgi:RecA-family ATPase
LPSPPNGKSRYYAACPQCSAQRSTPAHRKAPVLGITIDTEGVHFGCNHCGWTGGGYYETTEKQFPQQQPFTAIYDYVDESGNLLFQVCRKANKEFPQRRPTSNGEWQWNLDKIRRVLYRLPQLIEAVASDYIVFVVEGEKDADRLASLNIAATTNPGGASKWRNEYNEHLHGANVVIIPDNDPPGRAHAQAIAESLSSTASRIRLFDLAKHWPACPEGGDISDFLNAGHSVEQLWKLVGSLPDWKPETKPTPAEPLPYIDVAREPIPPRRWFVHEKIPDRNVSLFSGEGGRGKSLLAKQLSAATVLGLDWIGTLPEPGPVIYLNYEDDDEEICHRLTAIANHHNVSRKTLTDDLHIVSLVGQDAPLASFDRFTGAISPTRLFDRLHRDALRFQPKLIVLDSSADVFPGNEIDRRQTRQFITLLRRLSIDAKAATILISHPSLSGITSGSGLSGTTAWHNSTRARVYLKALNEDDGKESNDLRVLEFKKANYGPISESIVLRWRNGLYLPEPRAGSLEQLAAEAKVDGLFLDILQRLTKQGRNVSERKGTSYAPAIFEGEPEAKTVKVTRKQFAEAMTRLFAANKIKIVTEGPPSHRRSRLVEV